MNKAIHLPLAVHFILSAQGEFIHAFIDCDITAYGLSTMDGVNVDNAGAIIDQLPLTFAVLSSPNRTVYFYLLSVAMTDMLHLLC